MFAVYLGVGGILYSGYACCAGFGGLCDLFWCSRRELACGAIGLLCIWSVSFYLVGHRLVVSLHFQVPLVPGKFRVCCVLCLVGGNLVLVGLDEGNNYCCC